MNDKIMAIEDMENIANRLKGCHSLLYMLGELASTSATPVEAIDGIADLLDSIYRDLYADIEAAEYYIPTPAVTA